MLDFCDPRWGDDPRERDDDRPDISRGSRAGGDPRELRSVDPRDVFTERLDLPRGDARARVHVRDREYSLRGSESRTLATVGAFRVVSAGDLRDHDGRSADARRGDLRHLREAELVQTVPLEGHREPVVVLTDRGRDLLEAHRHDVDREPRQTFYAGVRKPRELEHDSQIYDAYLEAAERLHAADARIERVVVDYELKREYQRFLQEPNRDRSDSDGRPRRGAEEIEEWAREHDLRLYEAIGEPHSRLRRPVSASRALERLMLLDAVIALPELEWLTTEAEKVNYFTGTAEVSPDSLPCATMAPLSDTARRFPDGLPIGIESSGRVVFLYLVTDLGPDGFRTFLRRHQPGNHGSEFSGEVRWVEFDAGIAADDHTHLITPEERLQVAVAKQ